MQNRPPRPTRAESIKRLGVEHDAACAALDDRVTPSRLRTWIKAYRRHTFALLRREESQ